MADEAQRAGSEVPAREAGVLAGIRIIEFAGIGPAPFAAMLLADMGADIVRVERPGTASPWNGRIVNRGRPAVIADLKDPSDVQSVLTLIDRADALIEGFRPGVMERLGLGPPAVHARNPGLVYGRMTGWGQSGPLSATAGHDLNYIAITGALSAIGPKEQPLPPLNLVGDYGGGSLYLVTGLLAALLYARRTGAGQVVDCAVCDGTASLMAMFSDLSAQGRWTDDRQANLLDGGAPYYRTFECADGRFVSVGALEPHFYALLLERTGLTDAGLDRDKVADWPALHARLAAVFRTRTRAQWCDVFDGSDACVAPVMTLSEAPSHPHLAERQTFVEIDAVVQPAPAPRFSRTPSHVKPVAREALSLAAAVSRWRASTNGG